MEDNPYRAPGSFEKPPTHWLSTVAPAWTILTVATGLVLIAFDLYLLQSSGAWPHRAGQIRIIATVAWLLLMVVPGGIMAHYLIQVRRQ